MTDLLPAGTYGVGEAADDEAAPRRVTYLLGAGATHACIARWGNHRNLLMRGLRAPLAERLRGLAIENFADHAGIEDLVNNIADDDLAMDIEQVITFLDDAPSREYQDFANGLRVVFAEVLQEQLEAVQREEEGRYSYLYGVLVDMHLLTGVRETLNGFLTLNYDVFLEHAISTLVGRSVDFGVRTLPETTGEAIRVLKLHGSFGWLHNWPIEAGPLEGAGLWIPPGIRKVKSEYPFNAIWGLAREMLDCDILRVIGCRLSENDWDLISMIFTTRHGHASNTPYEIEIVDRPDSAEAIKERFPYLQVKSLLEIGGIGEQLVSESLGIEPTPYSHLSSDQKAEACRNASSKIGNPFDSWLKLKAEDLNLSLATFESDSGLFASFADANTE